MQDVDMPESKGRSRVGLTVVLLVAIVLCLGIVGAVLAPVLMSNQQGASAPGRSRVPSRGPTPSQTPLPDVTSKPHKLDEAMNTRLLFAYQSVGRDIAGAIPAVYKSAKLPAPKIMTWNRAKNAKGPVVATATIGQNGNALSKLRAYARMVNEAPRNSIGVSLLAFNYQDVNAETDIDDLFQSYADTMSSLEAANPDISFLYTTVPVTTANSWRSVERSTITGLSNVNQPLWQDNIARERLNTLLRERYEETGRLFDIAALQANAGGDKVIAKQHEDLWYYVMNPRLSRDGKRLNSVGARELAHVLALLVAASSLG